MSASRIILQTYEFDEQEVNSAQLLPELTLKWIKTQLANDSMRARNWVPDPNNYAASVQEKAHIDGAISAWEFLINGHEDVVRRLAVE